MGGDHHHKPKITIPDYSTYKIEGIPKLEAIQKYLASKGLRDPWLRNEVWRYDPKIWGTERMSITGLKIAFRGFKYGFAAFVATASMEWAYNKYYGGDLSDGHGDHDHH